MRECGVQGSFTPASWAFLSALGDLLGLVCRTGLAGSPLFSLAAQSQRRAGVEPSRRPVGTVSPVTETDHRWTRSGPARD